MIKTGFCKVCGEYGQGDRIEVDNICNACNAKMEANMKPVVKKITEALIGRVE